MLTQLIDGKKTAAHITAQLKKIVDRAKHNGQRSPGLAVILVGDDEASNIYVNHKIRACHAAGIHSEVIKLANSCDEATLLAEISRLNQDRHIDGILVQLPLPAHINEARITDAIDAKKDVDGFHPHNIGLLAQRRPHLRPCTPAGIITLLRHYQLPLYGCEALVVGASNIVGRPMMLELLLAGATATVTHRFTRDLRQHVQRAELIIVATGVMDVIDAAWLHEKHTVIDVGIHRLTDGSLRGDVDFQAALPRVRAITPVPGGVGPMTVAYLLINTVIAAGLDVSSMLNLPS